MMGGIVKAIARNLDDEGNGRYDNQVQEFQNNQQNYAKGYEAPNGINGKHLKPF